jgi:perosamine synthetase
LSSPRFLPVCSPALGGSEEAYVLDALHGGWISSGGEYVDRFEKGFARWSGRHFGVAASSGTAALHLALRAVGVGPGDEVVLPDFTMAACLFSVLYLGAKPVFVDVEPDTWTLDPALLEPALTPRTRAIMAVHIYGHPCEMDPVLEIAARRGAAVVEDAAEAHGAEYRGRRCGSFGAASAFSFFANKILTTGEGGMVLTDDPGIADRCRSFRNLCFPLAGARDYLHDDVGYNYRLTNLQAAVGVAQLERAEELVGLRVAVARRYLEQLDGVPGLQLPVERPHVRNVYWMFGVVVDPERFGMDRDALAAALRAEGIDTRPFFKPLHSQPALAKAGVAASGAFPVTERLAAGGLSLPTGPRIAAEDVDRVAAALRRLGRSGGA